MNDYPLLELFWTMLWFFMFIAWIWLLISLFADIFRRKDASGWVKALWVLFLIALPLLGALVYLIANGRGMAERSVSEVNAREESLRTYIRDVAGGSTGASTADEIAKLAELRDAGALTPNEFEAQKAKLLA